MCKIAVYLKLFSNKRLFVVRTGKGRFFYISGLQSKQLLCFVLCIFTRKNGDNADGNSENKVKINHSIEWLQLMFHY